MSGDVVKSNSKRGRNLLALLCTLPFLILSYNLIDKILLYKNLTETKPIILEEITWNAPHLEVKYSFELEGARLTHIETLPYMKAHTESHFTVLKNSIYKELTQAYFYKNKPYLTRPFPFQHLIYTALFLILYALLYLVLPLCTRLKPRNLFFKAASLLNKITH